MSDARSPGSLSLERSTIGPYTILGELGRGGMGTVYRARDSRLRRDVAIKVLSEARQLDPARLARFEQEARALAALSHPNIAAIYGMEESAGGAQALVLELVEGQTLATRLAGGRLPVSEALTIARQIAEALDAAHEKGIVHRDLKPANIAITPNGLVKVLDFGVAKMAEPTEASGEETRTSGLTHEGMVVGTAAYMSPEQARGQAVDKRTDIWAFGCLLYEMLTGRRSFQGDSTTDTLAAVLATDPDWSALPTNVSSAVRAMLKRCLERERSKRLGDVAAIRFALEDVAALSATDQQAVVGVSRYSRSVGTKVAWAIGGALIAIATLVSASFALSALGYSPFARGGDAQRVEFSMLPPPGVNWAELPPEPVARVSPNGKRIVFAGNTGNGLWVRDLDDRSARHLPGTNDYLGNTRAPFWSSDSRTIAYCSTANVLKKISVDGRSAGQLDVPCILDGSWNARGEILFAARDGIFLVGENGGRPKQVTFSDGPAEDHRHPRFLPDGRRFLFTERSPSAAKAGIYLGRTDDTNTQRLFPDASMAEYVETPDGTCYIVFVRVADLIAQRVDADLAPVSVPVVVAHRMAMGLSRLPSFSVSPSLLAYRNDVGNSEFVWMDRKGTPTGVRYEGTTALGAPAVSHDDRTLAYSRLNPETNYSELWTIDIARGVPQKIYAAQTIVAAPAFSPDDRRLAFTAGQREYILTLENPGSATEANPYPRTQTDCERPGTCMGAFVTDWSMEGDFIIKSPGVVAWFKPGQTTPPTRITAGVHARLSRDGNWIAYTSQELGRPEVYLQHFPDGAKKTRISLDGGFQPYWRADGREIFYRTPTGDIIAVQIRLGAQVVIEGTERLFRERLRAGGDDFSRRDFIVSGDGQRFLVNLPIADTPPVTVVRNWSQGLTP